jgi:hypothetical protein
VRREPAEAQRAKFADATPAISAIFQRLAEELGRGHHAAALEVDRDGTVGGRLVVDDDALARADDGPPEPIGTVLMRIATARAPAAIHAPAGLVSWQASALLRESDDVVWLLGAFDASGLPSLLLSRRRTSDGGDLGDRLLAALTRTKTPAKARVDRARRRLEPEDVKAVVAAAVYTYLESAASANDDGWQTRYFAAVRVDVSAREARFVAESPSQGRGGPGSRERRAALFGAVLGELEGEVFGTGLHSPRGSRPVLSLDTMVTSDSETTIGDLLPGDPDDPGRGVDLLDAVDDIRSVLTEREFDILARTAQCDPDDQIAAGFGISLGNLHTIRSRARSKLKTKL